MIVMQKLNFQVKSTIFIVAMIFLLAFIFTQLVFVLCVLKVFWGKSIGFHCQGQLEGLHVPIKRAS